MKHPDIKEGEFLLYTFEKRTGIMLNNDETYYLNTGTDNYLVFNNIVSARQAAAHKITTSSIELEFSIYDDKGGYVESINLL